MPWRIADPTKCLDSWAEGKNHDERVRFLNGLAELADSPMTQLPGLRVLGWSPMERWTIIGPTIVVFHVYETAGIIDLTEIRDL